MLRRRLRRQPSQLSAHRNPPGGPLLQAPQEALHELCQVEINLDSKKKFKLSFPGLRLASDTTADSAPGSSSTRSRRFSTREPFTQTSQSALSLFGAAQFMMFSTKLLSKLEKVILILRLYKNGFMKTLPVFSEFNMRDLLPLKVFCSSSSTISWQLMASGVLLNLFL